MRILFSRLQQIAAVLNASNSVKSSKKFRSILEIVLAFGNYLNSSKRGPAYGFKLQSLDTLLDTKSTDKRMCLLHYIVQTIRQKFPELLDFDTELFHIDKAAQVSLENVMADVTELDKGMEVVRKEADVRNKGPHNPVLKDFLTNSEEKLRKLKQEAKNAHDVFKECVEYFGESSHNTDANTFFIMIVRFVRSVKVGRAAAVARRSDFEFFVRICVADHRPGERAAPPAGSGGRAGGSEEAERRRRSAQQQNQSKEAAGEFDPRPSECAQC